MSYYGYNPYQPNGAPMNRAQISQYGGARTPRTKVPVKRGTVGAAVSIGQWIIAVILTAIPVINLIPLCVWAFGKSTAPSKANYARAILIFILIFVIIPLVVFGILCAIMWPTVAAFLQPIIAKITSFAA